MVRPWISPLGPLFPLLNWRCSAGEKEIDKKQEGGAQPQNRVVEGAYAHTFSFFCGKEDREIEGRIMTPSISPPPPFPRFLMRAIEGSECGGYSRSARPLSPRLPPARPAVPQEVGGHAPDSAGLHHSFLICLAVAGRSLCSGSGLRLPRGRRGKPMER